MNLNDAKVIFGLTHAITEEELKVTYRKLAISKHPDTNKSSRAKEEFQELQAAFVFLKKNLTMLPSKPKPKPEGDTLWRMFDRKHRQKVIVPLDSLIENDLVLYFLYCEREYRVALKKGVDLPTTIRVDSLDLIIDFEREKEPIRVRYK
jgi:hypothetical protein